MEVRVASRPAPSAGVVLTGYSDWLLRYLSARPFKTDTSRLPHWEYVGLLAPSRTLTRNRLGCWCVRDLPRQHTRPQTESWEYIAAKTGRLVERIGTDLAAVEVAADRYADVGGRWRPMGPPDSILWWTWVPA